MPVSATPEHHVGAFPGAEDPEDARTAPVGEFHRVGNEVEGDLPDPGRVAEHLVVAGVVGDEHQAKFFSSAVPATMSMAPVMRSPRLKRALQLECAGLDAGEIQHVVG